MKRNAAPDLVDCVIFDRNETITVEGVLAEFFIESKLSKKRIPVTKTTLNSMIIGTPKMSFLNLEYVDVIPAQDAVFGGVFPAEVQLGVSTTRIMNLVTPHIGPNKMDISKHMKWTGGYWVQFNAAAYSDALKATVAAPAPIHRGLYDSYKKKGELSATGDSIIDDSLNYLGVKFVRSGESSCRGWFPFVNGGSASSASGPYSPFLRLRSYLKHLCTL